MIDKFGSLIFLTFLFRSVKLAANLHCPQIDSWRGTCGAGTCGLEHSTAVCDNTSLRPSPAGQTPVLPYQGILAVVLACLAVADGFVKLPRHQSICEQYLVPRLGIPGASHPLIYNVSGHST
jgi:hypothetical protein